MRYLVAGEVLLAVGGDGRVFRFLPVTRLWHLVGAGAVDESARVVSSVEAGDLVGRLRPPSGRTRAAREAKAAAWRQIGRAGEVMTSAETGLTAVQLPGHRPITAPGLQALLEARGDSWTMVVRYDAGTDRTSHYHVLNGYRNTARFGFAIDARIVDRGEVGRQEIEIRRRPGDDCET